MTKEMVKRRICWPNPDNVCLQGGCGYCQLGRPRASITIEKYARDRGLITAYNWGLLNSFANAPIEYGDGTKTEGM